MQSHLITRPFNEQDATGLTELLHAAYARLGGRGLNFTAVDQDEQTTHARASAGQCWIVQDGHRMVGSLTMSRPPSAGLQQLTNQARAPHRAWLNQVAVHPTHQGAGIASHLWNLGLEWAADSGATSVGVDTAAPADHLIDLYRRWGFLYRTSIHWPGKTYDSVVMVRPIIRTPA